MNEKRSRKKRREKEPVIELAGGRSINLRQPKDGSLWDIVPLKISLLVRYYHDNKSFSVHCYDQGRLEANDEARPVRLVPDVLNRTKEIINYVRSTIDMGGLLSSGEPSGAPTLLVVEFWKPAGGRKNPLVSYKIFMGGNVALEKDPLILPLPGLERPGIQMFKSDDLLRPLVLTILGFCLHAIEKQKTTLLASKPTQGASDGGPVPSTSN